MRDRLFRNWRQRRSCQCDLISLLIGATTEIWVLVSSWDLPCALCSHWRDSCDRTVPCQTSSSRTSSVWVSLCAWLFLHAVRPSIAPSPKSLSRFNRLRSWFDHFFASNHIILLQQLGATSPGCSSAPPSLAACWRWVAGGRGSSCRWLRRRRRNWTGCRDFSCCSWAWSTRRLCSTLDRLQ